MVLQITVCEKPVTRNIDIQLFSINLSLFRLSAPYYFSANGSDL